jgi:omega-6 fatty acid desaturase (delta-12 desaturase)
MSFRSDDALAIPPDQAPGTGTAVLAPSDGLGLAHVALAAVLSATGFVLAASASNLVWLAGQLLLALAFLQWFILLHEAGHLTLFRRRSLNLAAGHLAGFLALIPFESWRRVHGLHHLWTGWQDLDPTTASLAPRPRARWEIAAVDLAWRFWLPLISIAYRIGNYWNLPRLWRHFPTASQRRALCLNALAALLGYGVILWVLGPWQVLSLVGLGLALSFALQDPLILSQHTHIPQRLAAGDKVVPLTGIEQVRHTRSLAFPTAIAQWGLMNFNLHELHHRHVAVPGYRLARIDHTPANTVHWWTWLRAAKRMRGSVFLYQSRDITGADV